MRYVALLAASAATLVLSGAAFAQDKPEIAFVVNGPSDFWKIMEAAVAKAQTELPDVTLSFKYPERADAAVSAVKGSYSTFDVFDAASNEHSKEHLQYVGSEVEPKVLTQNPINRTH